MTPISPGIAALGMALTILLTAVLVPYILAVVRENRDRRRQERRDADTIREACADYDRLADAAQRGRQSEVLAKLLGAEPPKQQIAKPLPLDLPRLEDGARWLDME